MNFNFQGAKFAIFNIWFHYGFFITHNTMISFWCQIGFLINVLIFFKMVEYWFQRGFL